MLSSAYTSGWLIAKVGPRPVLGLMAFFPLLMCFTAGLIREQRQQDSAPSTPEPPSPSAGEYTYTGCGHPCGCCPQHNINLSVCLTLHSSIACGVAPAANRACTSPMLFGKLNQRHLDLESLKQHCMLVQMQQLRCMRMGKVSFSRNDSRVCWRRRHMLTVQG